MKSSPAACATAIASMFAPAYLNSDRQPALALNFCADRRHSGHNLRPNLTFEVRNIMHILDNDSLHPTLVVYLRLLTRRSDQLPHTSVTSRRPRQRSDMNHSDNWLLL